MALREVTALEVPKLEVPSATISSNILSTHLSFCCEQLALHRGSRDRTVQKYKIVGSTLLRMDYARQLGKAIRLYSGKFIVRLFTTRCADKRTNILCFVSLVEGPQSPHRNQIRQSLWPFCAWPFPSSSAPLQSQAIQVPWSMVTMSNMSSGEEGQRRTEYVVRITSYLRSSCFLLGFEDPSPGLQHWIIL